MPYRRLVIPNMWARMQRLQDEDLNDKDDDPGDDEIYRIVTVIQRSNRGVLEDTHVGGSDNYVTFTQADRGKWKELQHTGEWMGVWVPSDSQIEVTWYLMEEDSILDDDLEEALGDLVKGITEEIEGLPGIARAKRLYALITKVVASISGDDVLGTHKRFFDLSQLPQPFEYRRTFSCNANDADYTAWARLNLGKSRKR